MDRLRLLAVDHPAGVEIHPLRGPDARAARRSGCSRRRTARPPRRAGDDHGHDVRPRSRELDRAFADDFPLHRIRGYAERARADARPRPGRRRRTRRCCSRGGPTTPSPATTWPRSRRPRAAAAVAPGQGRRRPLADRDRGGRHPRRPAADAGGRPGGRWRGPSRRVRIVTNMRIYWDQVARGPSGPIAARRRALDAERGATCASAASRPRHARRARAVRLRLRARLLAPRPGRSFPGRYTRAGDVRELLRRGDDMFVISRPGDEIALSFDAGALPPLPAGWRAHVPPLHRRLQQGDGHQLRDPRHVGPLPFHAMSRYPYEPPEAYPLTAERRALIERYNTRVVRDPLPPLELRSRGIELRVRATASGSALRPRGRPSSTTWHGATGTRPRPSGGHGSKRARCSSSRRAPSRKPAAPGPVAASGSVLRGRSRPSSRLRRPPP